MHSSGVAIFEDSILKDTVLLEITGKVTGEEAVVAMISLIINYINKYEPDILVVETQKPHATDRMSKQALMHLGAIPLGVLGYAKSIGIKTKYFTPMQWKGNVPKKIMLKRIYKNELKLESMLYLFADGQSDILDAIGIGRHFLGRR